MRKPAREIALQALITGTLMLTVGSSMAMSAVAYAAEGDDERGFPELAPEWYVTAPASAYGTGSPSPQSDGSRISEGFHVTYWHPDGSAPSRGQGDISVDYTRPISEPPTDAIEINLGAFENLEATLGTTFTDAIYLPIKDEAATDELINQVAQSGGVYFNGSALVISRQAEPCAVKKLRPTYEFQVALLGSNGYKYLADLDIDLGERPANACSTPESTEADLEEPAAAEAAVEPEAAEPAEATPAKSSVENLIDDESYEWFPLIVAGLILVVIVIGVKIARAKPKAFKADGNPLATSRTRASRPAGDENNEREGDDG